MDLEELEKQATLILDQERKSPTLGYTFIGKTFPTDSNFYIHHREGHSLTVTGIYALNNMRGQRPRGVWERPAEWMFNSRNYELLMLILQKVSDAQKQILVKKMIVAALSDDQDPKPNNMYPSWNGCTSGLPLMAEICVRNGHLKWLFEVLHQIPLPNANVAVMMIHMEEIIALNFDTFTKPQVEEMPVSLAPIREVAYAQTWQTKGPRGGTSHEVNPRYRKGFHNIGNEIVSSIDAFFGQCQRALYLYVEGILRQSRNPDVEGDKIKVESYLRSLNFSPLLTGALEKAEELYTKSTDAFDRKSCLGHLRSFIEHLHLDATAAIAKNMNTFVAPGWDPALTFLKNNLFLTMQQEKFARGLYMLSSDEGVHPLIADQEFARLLRSMTIEYGLMFLTMFAQKGIKIS